MKTIFICFLFFYSVMFSQDLPLKGKLESRSWGLRWAALEQISREGLTEYIPLLEEQALDQPIYDLRYSFLKTLVDLHSKNAQKLIVRYISEIEIKIPEPPFNNLDINEAKNKAAILLIDLGDYSQVDLIFNYLSNEPVSTSTSGFVSLLIWIYNKVPEKRPQVISHLLNHFNSEKCSSLTRTTILRFFDSINYEDIVELSLSGFEDENDEELRNISAWILYERNIPELRKILMARIPIEPAPSSKIHMISRLITMGEPSDINYVKNFIPTEKSEDHKFIHEINLSKFIPKKPEFTVGEMIDSLNSYTDQLYQFGWIKNEVDYKLYKEKTKNLRELFEQKKTDELCSNLNWIISQAESQHGSDLLTEEGYKFLFYYTGYIKEKIETEFGTCK
ncbi:MAG: hypothetical protein IPM56_05250 [Ignavibacteriales bacterium]|nr:MAG: hypothetical protein IPM56_05250 [Ignavibacteriales bacterium]